MLRLRRVRVRVRMVGQVKAGIRLATILIIRQSLSNAYVRCLSDRDLCDCNSSAVVELCTTEEK